MWFIGLKMFINSINPTQTAGRWEWLHKEMDYVYFYFPSDSSSEWKRSGVQNGGRAASRTNLFLASCYSKFDRQNAYIPSLGLFILTVAQRNSWCLRLLCLVMTLILYLHFACLIVMSWNCHLSSKMAEKGTSMWRIGYNKLFFLCRNDYSLDYSGQWVFLWQLLQTPAVLLICLLLTNVGAFTLPQPTRLPSAVPENQILPPRPLGFITESLFTELNRITSSHRSRKLPITRGLPISVCS